VEVASVVMNAVKTPYPVTHSSGGASSLTLLPALLIFAVIVMTKLRLAKWRGPHLTLDD